MKLHGIKVIIKLHDLRIQVVCGLAQLVSLILILTSAFEPHDYLSSGFSLASFTYVNDEFLLLR